MKNIFIVVLVVVVAILAYMQFRPKVNLAIPNGQTTTTVPSDWKTSKNTQYKFDISYPSDYQIQESNDGGFFNELNLYEISIGVPLGYQTGTDFNVGRIQVSVSPKIDKCYSSNGEETTKDMTATKVINGSTFHYNPKQPMDDSAMGGQRGSYYIFSTIENNQCYRVSKLVGYRDSRGFTKPPYPSHFDEQKLNADLDAVISTLLIR